SGEDGEDNEEDSNPIRGNGLQVAMTFHMALFLLLISRRKEEDNDEEDGNKQSSSRDSANSVQISMRSFILQNDMKEKLLSFIKKALNSFNDLKLDNNQEQDNNEDDQSNVDEDDDYNNNNQIVVTDHADAITLTIILLGCGVLLKQDDTLLELFASQTSKVLKMTISHIPHISLASLFLFSELALDCEDAHELLESCSYQVLSQLDIMFSVFDGDTQSASNTITKSKKAQKQTDEIIQPSLGYRLCLSTLSNLVTALIYQNCFPIEHLLQCPMIVPLIVQGIGIPPPLFTDPQQQFIDNRSIDRNKTSSQKKSRSNSRSPNRFGSRNASFARNKTQPRAVLNSRTIDRPSLAEIKNMWLNSNAVVQLIFNKSTDEINKEEDTQAEKKEDNEEINNNNDNDNEINSQIIHLQKLIVQGEGVQSLALLIQNSKDNAERADAQGEQTSDGFDENQFDENQFTTNHDRCEVAITTLISIFATLQHEKQQAYRMIRAAEIHSSKPPTQSDSKTSHRTKTSRSNRTQNVEYQFAERIDQIFESAVLQLGGSFSDLIDEILQFRSSEPKWQDVAKKAEQLADLLEKIATDSDVATE
ncbi:MAG: hypothetical protein EZS28_020290, partial [Streblomastix strix]